MIHHQINWNLWLNNAGIAAEGVHRVPHRRQINQTGNPRQVLQQYARGLKWDFALFWGFGVPLGQTDHIIFGDLEAIAVAEQRFQQHPNTIRQPRERCDADFF